MVSSPQSYPLLRMASTSRQDAPMRPKSSSQLTRAEHHQSISSSVAGPSPNAGYSLDAPEAMKMSGWERLAVDDWKQCERIDESKQIRLVRLSHMRYMHPDLNTITQFLLDFGTHIVKKTDDTVWMRGYGSEPYVYVAEKGPEKKYLGGAWTVESYEELEKATKLPNASPIEELTSSPGGGYRLTFHDPEGFPVNLIFGQTPAETGKLPQKLIYNFEKEKSREGAFQRFKPGPAAVHKLGHYGLCVSDLPAQVQFYTRNFNLVPSDFLRVPDESAPGGLKDVGFFAHVDRGEEFVDHHSFFMSSAPTAHVHHASFEVHDFDTQLLGHQWLAAKNYKSVWGVGRHILGSQIFDYWWDTTGFMIEHYTDGDTVNNKTPIGLGPAGSESLSVWGPELPLDFLD